MIYNGELQNLQLPDQVYLYQNIHTLNYQPRYLEHHIEILTTLAESIWQTKTTLTEKKISKEIHQLLDTSRLSRNVSICVILRLYASGDYSIHVGEVSFYAGYVLRSLRPVIKCIEMDVAMSALPSSARKASYDLAHQMALVDGYHESIMIDSSGLVVEDPLRPVATIKNYTLQMPSPSLWSVECMLLEQAAELSGLNVTYERISLSDIANADEVLTVTYQGVTSVSRIGEKNYFVSLADKIAKTIETLELQNTSQKKINL